MTDLKGVAETDALVVDALPNQGREFFNKRTKATYAFVDVATIDQFVAKRKKDAARIFDAPDDMVELFFENQWMKNRLGMLAEYLDNILDAEIAGPTTGPELNAHLKFIRQFKQRRNANEVS